MFSLFLTCVTHTDKEGGEHKHWREVNSDSNRKEGLPKETGEITDDIKEESGEEDGEN